MNKCKRWLKTIAYCTAGLLIALIILVVVVDPFFQYHAPLKGFPYIIDNQVNQNPGMARHMSYDSIILGSSMTANFDTRWFDELMGLNTLKLTYNGAFPQDIDNMMSLAFNSGNEIKKVFLGVDTLAYTSELGDTRYPIPQYLYDKNIFNDISYVLNKDVLFLYILKPIFKHDAGTDLSTVYHLVQTDGMFDGKYIFETYDRPEIASEEAEVADLLSRLETNLDANICPYIEAHPDTEFVIFYPPYSILFWDGMIRQKMFNAMIDEYRLITDKLMDYDNVHIYLFLDNEEIITDLTNYSDYSHYHEKINRYMTECFVSGECELTKENAIDRIDGMQQFALEYDYDSLFEEGN